MKTTFDIENSIYAVLNVTSFTSLFIGELFNGRKPFESPIGENVVISSNTADLGQVQVGIAYVKCWAKDIDGFTNPKIDTIIKKADELVQSASVNGYEFRTLNVSVVPDDQNAGWSIGFVRVECYINNL